MEGIGRSPFDLPLNNREKLLDRWIAEGAGNDTSGRDLTTWRVKMMLDASSVSPAERPGGHKASR